MAPVLDGLREGGDVREELPAASCQRIVATFRMVLVLPLSSGSTGYFDCLVSFGFLWSLSATPCEKTELRGW